MQFKKKVKLRNQTKIKLTPTCWPTGCKTRCDWADWTTADWYRWVLAVAERWRSSIEGLLATKSVIWWLTWYLPASNALALFPRCPAGSPRRPVYIRLCINHITKSIFNWKKKNQNQNTKPQKQAKKQVFFSFDYLVFFLMVMFIFLRLIT